MVLTAGAHAPARAGAAEPAVVVPDQSTWALWGEDLRAHGFVSAATPAAASVLLVPRVVPSGLAAAVESAWAEMPPPRRLVELDGPDVPGLPAAELVAAADEGAGRDGSNAGDEGDGHGEAADHDHGDDGHDHHDMMEITGEPSGDGLVMESIEFEHGPLAPGLPSGVVLEVELDGDVVCSCAVRASLRQAGSVPPTGHPDPLAPAAWAVALGRAAGGSPPQAVAIAAIEGERALSHLAWLGGFATVLGWAELGAQAWAAAASLIEPAARLRELLRDRNADEPPAAAALATSLEAARSLRGRLGKSRRLSARARGRGVVSAEEARTRGLTGPNARACGLGDDTRSGEAAYAALGFEPHTCEGGDVEARVLQRVGESVDALELASRALESGSDLRGEPVADVEGPRGPLRTAPAPSAPGSGAARGLAGERAADLEWASALATVASFDLSPWMVPG